ncbi:UPF0711 protein C18orf21 homolog isoform X2 [Antennarius striatus]|uniref:UPF0711 protein C18orf21 homolog isoform X2 n=1 Tax=Antennarius striatus TaxID=241820 RepID=UPI0035B2CF7D
MTYGRLSHNFLLNASLLYEDKCPELSRHLLQRTVTDKAPAKQNPSKMLQKTSFCPNCYQWLRPDNHRMRLLPKKRPPLLVQRILRKKAKGRWLTPVQRKLLHRFQMSSSVLMATCHTCSTPSRYKGMNRDFITNLARTHNTPGSAGKHKTPQSANRSNMTTPKTPGKDKTPGHTPRSSTSSGPSGSGSSSSKPLSKPKNWVVQRLSKILMRQDNQGSKKGGLKHFLSSL